MTTSLKEAPAASTNSSSSSIQETEQSAAQENPASVSKGKGPRGMSPKHLWVVALLVGLAAIGMITTNLNSADSLSEQSSKLTDPAGAVPQTPSGAISVNVVRVGSLSAPSMSHSYPGMLIARRESQLGFERAGRIVNLSVEEGDRVQAGDVLGQLDQEDLDASQQRIESELAVEEAVLEELIAGPRKETIEAAQARVDELSARVELAQVEADRQRRLATENATSRSQLDAAVFGLKATQRSLIAARFVLQELQEGSRAEKVAAQRAKCSSMQARLSEIQAQRNDSTIVAPFAGQVQSRLLDEGGVVSAGQAVLHLLSHEFEVQVGLPSEIALQVSRQGEVNVAKGDLQVTGVADRLAPSVNRVTRTRDVFLKLPSQEQDFSNEGWVPGEIVSVMIDTSASGMNDNKYWLPISSIVRGTRGLWTALVIPGDSGEGVCERRSLEVLKTDGTFALVQGMIDEGDRVVADGLHKVTAGLLVVEAQ